MTALVAAALAHPVGGHAVVHALDWRVARTSTQVRYQVEVPAALLGRAPPEAMRDELVSGLRLEVDGATVPLVLASDSARGTEHGAHFVLTLQAPLAPGTHDLELSNGNLPDTTGLHRTTLVLAPDADLWATSLLVDGPSGLRDDSGRTRATPEARTTSATVHTASNPLEQLHRALQGRENRGPGEALQRSLLRSDRTTAPMLLGLPLLGLLALPAPRWPDAPVWAGLAAIAALDLSSPAGFSEGLVLVAAVAALVSLRRPTAAWLVAPALAASLDVRGIAVPVIALQLVLAGRAPGPLRSRAVVAVALGLSLLQAARLYP
ncbi:MAG: hypothetical protein R3F61_10915 [Myxococcota bacterium]